MKLNPGSSKINGMIQPKEQKNIIKQIESVSKKRKEINLSYLFGSFALGTTNRSSDVDIAIYLDSKKVKEIFLIPD